MLLKEACLPICRNWSAPGMPALESTCHAAPNPGSPPHFMPQGLAGSTNAHKLPTEEKMARDTPKGLRGSHNHPESQEPHIQKETHVATGELADGVQDSPSSWCVLNVAPWYVSWLR